MLTILIGTDWVSNRNAVLDMIAKDVASGIGGQILMVPELISHDTERRLCETAGDTASRFAEVLTFTRLVKRVSDFAGCGVPECLDNGGRLVAMASVTRQLKSVLKSYAAVETKPDFLTGLVDAVDEFKRCCISSKDLLEASKRTEGSFAQKLEELSLILEAYDGICARGKRDPRDQMTWLLEQMEGCDFAKNHIFYVDGFPDFTHQHIAILSHMIAESSHVVVSLNCDVVDSENPAFEKAGNTAGELLCIANNLGVRTEVVTIAENKRPILEYIPHLFQGKTKNSTDIIKTYHTDSLCDECYFVAEQIDRLVKTGIRYRDISVVCTNMDFYGNLLNMVFGRFGIPVYRSGTENILDKTVIATVLSAIDVIVSGFESDDVLRYIKSSLSPLDISQCDKLENYAIMWNISGSRWLNSWDNHPKGLGEKWTEEDEDYLENLNIARSTALMPLVRLDKAMKSATSLGQLVDALYQFLNEIELDIRLQNLSVQMHRSGDLRTAQVLNQLWEILLSALQQLSDTLGDTYWDVQTFSKLLKLLLSQYDVGTIPAVLDAVMIGPVNAMRCQNPDYVFILGACEGDFPAYSGSVGVLTDQERIALRHMGVPLTGGAIEGLQAEYAEIYGVFCGANNSVTVSYSEGQPSFLYRRLCEFSAGEITVNPINVPPNKLDIASYLLRNGAYKQSLSLDLEKETDMLQKLTDFSMGNISTEIVEKLYGSKLKLSASQVDKLADCRLAYFLKYGLKLKERKPVTVDPAEFGTYVHAVLEETCRQVMELGGFHAVSLERTLEIANTHSEKYILDRFSQIDSKRIQYLFRRNIQELELVVTELWEELKESSFEPVAFEHSFDAIPISGKSMTAHLRGFVDRVDAWNQNGQVYYRVVDYKTGKKDFDYCDVYNGLGLQMLLYLFALQDDSIESLGANPVPCGVQYFPARVPVISVDGRPDGVDSLSAREKNWKRKGLLLSDEDVLNAMEFSDNPYRLPIVRKKDGSISGDLADRKQMVLLKRYVFALLSKMVDDISSGCVEPNPYTRGGRHNACAFCPYGAVCHPQTVEGRRDYAAMSQQKFWEEIEKEMSNRGSHINK